jgi:methylated-DNA-[protein]-cysteine S-methyltransferase
MRQTSTFRNEPLAHAQIVIGRLPSSSVGPLWVACSEVGLVAVEWEMPEQQFVAKIRERFSVDISHEQGRTAEPLRQLAQYLSGCRQRFELPLDLSDCTVFQQQVLHITALIPYGQTMTYKDVAIRLGRQNASRAVGRVEATNPIPLVIPCHRVIGTDGSLHGYGGPGGIKLKTWLLNLEGVRLK